MQLVCKYSTRCNKKKCSKIDARVFPTSTCQNGKLFDKQKSDERNYHEDDSEKLDP